MGVGVVAKKSAAVWPAEGLWPSYLRGWFVPLDPQIEVVLRLPLPLLRMFSATPPEFSHGVRRWLLLQPYWFGVAHQP